MKDTIAWFGNPTGALGCLFPALMAYLATFTEIFGAILLAIGLAVRWICIPLMITMVVAAVSVHWQYGWLAIAEEAACSLQKEPQAPSSAWIAQKTF